MQSVCVHACLQVLITFGMCKVFHLVLSALKHILVLMQINRFVDMSKCSAENLYRMIICAVVFGDIKGKQCNFDALLSVWWAVSAI